MSQGETTRRRCGKIGGRSVSRENSRNAKSGAKDPAKKVIRQDSFAPVRAVPDKNNVLMQDLKPTVWIGKQGCTDQILSEIITQLKTRKAIKVKWLQHTEISPEEIAKSTGARLLQVRGRTLVLEERRKL